VSERRAVDLIHAAERELLGEWLDRVVEALSGHSH
jgi:hypothetical protein